MGFFTRFKRLLYDRLGSQTIEYVVILAAGAALAMILQSAVDSQEVKGALLQKIEQAISLDGSTAPKGKDRTEDSPGLIASGVDYVKNGWNRLTGSSPNSTDHPKIQRTMNMDVLGNGGFGGPKGGPRGAGGHVDNGGGYGYKGDGGNGSAKGGGNAKESPSFFERFTGWFDNKWNSLTKRFKGGGGSNASGGKSPNSGKGGNKKPKEHKSKLTPDEKKMVDDLEAMGKKVVRIPESTKKGERTPDFKVDGVPTELKTLQNRNTNTGSKRVRKGFKQNADEVIIDGRKAGLTKSEADEIIKRVQGSYKAKGEKMPGKVQIWIKDGIQIYNP
ncbi:DUF4244 domain-containing protein [Kroppenstedtia eburnea]|uniref:DUF4244 domain-containing protein n=1 Tax=Kroppenstedtia eburnea TaxID=714067 RepID=UPI00362585C9